MAEDRPQTVAEEIVNSLSHGLGFLLAVASLPILVSVAAERGSAASVVGACAFSVTAMLLYFSSAMYHALPDGRAKQVFNTLDHSAIYLFIAGSYTPFALGALRGPWGWTLFGLVWGLAALGVVLKGLRMLRHPGWSTGLYVAMGWLVLLAAVPLVQQMAFNGLVLLVAGGLAYTAGAVVFLFDSRFRYAHFVWHLFVLGGSTCHFFAALWHAG
ncbi:PAQR family membrane homeostasis protein TrhA [Piscinibacter sp.]|uniref:PAQR family membrane homeostasis protein TrhA n=1 Tax=Piscinibacter sp. TaxID=1903157 RepID=UPI002BDB64F9|nr:hemolysin III family protein [Albitalea sp.]HUG21674.1 hemolysin III family protein [Albitalea sp.]